MPLHAIDRSVGVKGLHADRSQSACGTGGPAVPSNGFRMVRHRCGQTRLLRTVRGFVTSPPRFSNAQSDRPHRRRVVSSDQCEENR
jgi:hypothetical protein